MIRWVGDCLRKFARACGRILRRSGRAVTWALPLLLLAAGAAPLDAQANFIPAGLPLGQGAGGGAAGVAHVVGSILSYTRWPQTPDPVRLCVVGAARHDARLNGALPGGVTVTRRDFPAGASDIASACDAIYFGDIGQTAMRVAVAAVRGKATLTIAENDPACRGGAMFCLRFDSQLSFALNIDAITRSAIRVDPRVLRISRGY